MGSIAQSNGDLPGSPTDYLDIHAHFFLPMTLDEAEQISAQMRGICFMVKEPLGWDAKTILDYNDRAGVRMQMLSYIPPSHEKLRLANNYGAGIVREYPSRFGLLAALPTDDPEACLAEIKRVTNESQLGGIEADGFATSTVYNQVSLGDARLEPVWEELNRRGAVVHIHPNAYGAGIQGRPLALLEVAFDTCRTVVDMMYAGVFRRWPDIKFVLGHCGGALASISGRIELLGTQSWVPNPLNITREEIEEQLSRLYVDTAATAKTGLAPAAKMVGIEKCIYGADCGVPCSSEQTMDENKADVEQFEKEMGVKVGTIARNGWDLFPAAAKRAQKAN